MTRVPSWLDAPWVPLDTETTGVDVENDLIVQAALAFPSEGTATVKYLNWDVDIPEGAAAVHGLTRERLAEVGQDPAAVLVAVVLDLVQALQSGAVLVGMNLVFDLTMLDRNCRRLGLPTLSDHVDIAPVVDAFVLDKMVDPYRKGKRNLTALCEHYRVTIGQAHDALADATAAARVAYRIGRVFPQMGALDPLVLHSLQAAAKPRQDQNLARYLKGQGRSTDGLDGSWPIRPLPTPALAVPDASHPDGTTPSLFEEGPPW